MRVAITTIGKDKPGIIARISGELAACNANILDITQTIMQDLFTMTMLVDTANISCSFEALRKQIQAAGDDLQMVINVYHEDVFRSMHRI